MPRNIELKARAADWDAQLRAAAAMAGEPELLLQEDTFFECRRGRLKLRRLQEGKASYLIFYTRGDAKDPTGSDYRTCPVPDPAALKAVLSSACGEGLSVRKKRLVFLKGRTRIHFDEVEGLGRFLELEVCMRPGEPDSEGEAEARSLMRELGIGESDLVACAYADLLGSAGA